MTFLFLFSFVLSVEGSSGDYRLRKAGDDMLLKCVNTGSQNGNCYALIANSGEILLLDCGVPYIKIMRAIERDNKYPISSISGILLSHKDGDHIRGIKEFLRKGIECYGCDELKEYIETKYRKLINGVPEKKGLYVGSFWVTPFYVYHDDTPNFAYIIDMPEESGRLLYATDFCYLPVILKANRINHFLIECNHMQEFVDQSESKHSHSVRGHSELQTVKEIIRLNKTADMRNIILCHLSEDWSDPDRMKQEIQEVAGKWVRVEVAEKNSVVSLSKYPF